MNLEWPSYVGDFYDIGDSQVVEALYGVPDHPNALYIVAFQLHETRIFHYRDVYNILDLIGDLGGVLEIFVLFFNIFVGPISEFSFLLKAIEKLFLAQTKDPSIFKKTSMTKKNS